MSFGRSGLRAIGGLAALVLVAFGASAWAQPSTYCVKATKVSKIISGKTKHVFTGGFNDKGCASVNATHEGKFEKLAAVIPALVWHPLGLQNGWEVYGGGEWGSPS
jgi:hypothetical protein